MDRLGMALGLLGIFVGGPLRRAQCVVRRHHDPVLLAEGGAICRCCYSTTARTPTARPYARMAPRRR